MQQNSIKESSIWTGKYKKKWYDYCYVAQLILIFCNVLFGLAQKKYDCDAVTIIITKAR